MQVFLQDRCVLNPPPGFKMYLLILFGHRSANLQLCLYLLVTNNTLVVLLITQRIVITPSCLRQRRLLVRPESHAVKVFAAAEGSKVSSHLLLISDEDDQITEAHISVGLQRFGGSFFRAPATAGRYLGGIIKQGSMSSINCRLRQLGRYNIFI